LLDARYAYQRASTGPVAEHTPTALEDARLALEAANRSYATEGGSERTRTLAYVALRKAQVAESRTRAELAERERLQAEQQLVASNTSGAARLRKELDRARSELTEAQRLRTEAEQRQSQLLRQQEDEARRAQELARQQEVDKARQEEEARAARLTQLEAQLEQERQARLQAEQRAAQAQADAQAQAQLAEQLRNIRQVEVKEEARGLVLTLSGSVLFRSGSADLLAVARRRLDEVAEALKTTQNPLVIEGHTDSQGPEELNEELSHQRAEAVRDYLVERGVDGERIRITGQGESRPIASNQSAEGRANNRRVEIVLERGVGGAGGQQQNAPATPDKPTR
jgi:outer membrane protein OmpA-like peptidoglycan-associated protein